MGNNLSAFVYTGRERVPATVVRVEVRSVNSIPVQAFKRRKNLRSVQLPEGLLTIDHEAFEGCSSMVSIIIPSSVTAIGRWSFLHCARLKSVHLPEGLRAIRTGAFQGCSSLESVCVPHSVAAIGDSAFMHCTSLREVRLPEGLVTIGQEAFVGCSSLESIVIPSSVTAIVGWSFLDCTSLSSVQLPEGLLTIGPKAFGGCSSLGSFRFARLSERMAAIHLDRQTEVEIENDLAVISALAKSGGESWTVARDGLERIHSLISLRELEEATTILELVLWKAKIEAEGDEGARKEGACRRRQVGQGPAQEGEHGTGVEESNREESNEAPQLSRKECRVKCGADIVMKEVVRYLN